METQQPKPKRQRVKIVAALLVGLAIGELRPRPTAAPKPPPDLSGRMTIRHYDGALFESEPIWIRIDGKLVHSAASQVKGKRQVFVTLADGRISIDAAEVGKQ